MLISESASHEKEWAKKRQRWGGGRRGGGEGIWGEKWGESRMDDNICLCLPTAESLLLCKSSLSLSQLWQNVLFQNVLYFKLVRGRSPTEKLTSSLLEKKWDFGVCARVFELKPCRDSENDRPLLRPRGKCVCVCVIHMTLCAILRLDMLSNNPTLKPCDFDGLIWHISALLKTASQKVFWQQQFLLFKKEQVWLIVVRMCIITVMKSIQTVVCSKQKCCKWSRKFDRKCTICACWYVHVYICVEWGEQCSCWSTSVHLGSNISHSYYILISWFSHPEVEVMEFALVLKPQGYQMCDCSSSLCIKSNHLQLFLWRPEQIIQDKLWRFPYRNQVLMCPFIIKAMLRYYR